MEPARVYLAILSSDLIVPMGHLKRSIPSGIVNYIFLKIEPFPVSLSLFSSFQYSW